MGSTSDRRGEPYILHPLRLMAQFTDRTRQIIAVLHDVVEDSAYTLEDLRARGFQVDVLDAIACLTKQPGEAYPAFIQRVKANPLASAVKLADLTDNMNLARLRTPLQEADLLRLKKYHDALNVLRPSTLAGAA